MVTEMSVEILETPQYFMQGSPENLSSLNLFLLQGEKRGKIIHFFYSKINQGRL